MTRTAIVTGAGTGIGRATAVALSEAGWRVALIGRREAPLRETADLCDAALVMPCDVTREAEVETAFATVRETTGRIDFLFNNAGIFSPAALIDDMPMERWHEALAVNLTGAVICARAAFAAMRAQSPQGGRIVNNGSISAHAPRPLSLPYTTTKHAITGLTKSLSLDGRPYAIACGQIDIGNALTEMTGGIAEGAMQADGTIKPEPVMDAAHVAASVVHMAGLPLDANIQFLTIAARNMPWLARG